MALTSPSGKSKPMENGSLFLIVVTRELIQKVRFHKNSLKQCPNCK
jgi:hypothetical protein